MPLRTDLLTVAEAAAALDVSPATITGAIRRGSLAAVPIDGRTKAIAPDEVERYRRENRGRLFGHDPTAPRTKGAEYAHAYRQRKKLRDTAQTTAASTKDDARADGEAVTPPAP